MAPNEVGDMLAGIIGPIGLLWLVLGFWLQGDELRNSVDALNLQSEELRNSVEQQKAMVEITRQQAEAEINALHEERKLRKMAVRPRLVLEPVPGGISATDVRLNFRIKNVGADCFNLKVCDLSSEENQVLAAHTLSKGDSQSFAISFEKHARKNFHILALCLDREENHVLTGFRVYSTLPEWYSFETIELSQHEVKSLGWPQIWL
jgi:hypothetical protein